MLLSRFLRSAFASIQQHAIQGSLCPLKVPPGAISYLHDLGRNPGKVGLAPFHFSALPACGDCLRTGTRMFRAPACGTRPSQLALAFVIAHFARLAVVLPGNSRRLHLSPGISSRDLPPEVVLEPIRRQLGVSHRVLDVAGRRFHAPRVRAR
jgi:hypothetical protein